MQHLVASRVLLPLLNGRGPFVIVASADVHVSAGHQLPTDIMMLEYVSGKGPEDPAELRRLNERKEEDLVPLVSAPSALCTLVCLSERGRSQLMELEDWWRRNGPGLTPQVVDVSTDSTRGSSGGSWDALYHRLLETLQGECDATAKRETDLQGELFELRREYEQTRVACEQMQDLLHRLRLAPWHLALILRPGRGVYQPARDSGTATGETPVPQGTTTGPLIQMLPCSAEGLAGIDLHHPLERSGVRRDGVLEVSVRSRENRCEVGRWHVPYGDLGAGWFRLAFPETLSAGSHHVAMHVSWRTQAGPSLSLADVEGWPELLAKQGETRLGGALAMRLWRGVPGTRFSSEPAHWAPAGTCDTARSTEYELSAEDYRRIRDTTPRTSPMPIELLSNDVGFRLHPMLPARKISSALLPEACPGGVDRVSATVRIAHEAGVTPVDYALCLTASTARCLRFPAEPHRTRGVLGWSGWITIPPDGQWHAVVLDLEEPLAVAADLHMATRVTGEYNRFARAEWRRIACRTWVRGVYASQEIVP